MTWKYSPYTHCSTLFIAFKVVGLIINCEPVICVELCLTSSTVTARVCSPLLLLCYGKCVETETGLSGELPLPIPGDLVA